MPSPPVSAGWTRRSVLATAALGALFGLTACRVRLQDNAPHIPLLPRRTPMADEVALTQLLVATWQLENVAASVPGGGMPSRVAALHATQSRALSRVLVAGGAPLPTRSADASSAPPASGSAAGPSSPSATSSGSAASTSRALHDGERAGLVALLSDLATVSAAHAPLLVSVAAQRAAAVSLLGAAPAWPTLRAPTGAAAVPLLAATRSAVYGFEVIATQTDAKHRPLADAALSVLRARVGSLEQLAGASAGPPPLGYELPYQVHDTASSIRLARHLLLNLAQDTAAAAASISGSPGLTSVTRWLSDTDVLAARWGTATAAFPGLVTP